jgi:excisionase family DNA binding protein
VSASKANKRPGQAPLAKPEPEPGVGADDPDRAVMTLHQVAEYLDCSYATVLLRVMRYGLLAFRLGGAGDGWRVRRSDLEKWVTEKQVRPAGSGPRAGYLRRGPSQRYSSQSTGRGGSRSYRNSRSG